MSSHGGQQNFPFGYQPENIHGLGLPEFINPGPPPGQPLLNAHENQDLDNFFHDFDQNAAANKHMAQSQFNMVAGTGQYYAMPPMFVGSDTGMGNRYVMDPVQLQGAGLSYGPGMVGQHMNTVKHPNTVAGGMPGVGYNDTAYADPLITQLQTAASMQPAFGPAWQHSYPSQNSIAMPQLQGRQAVSFGTDSRFQPTGYAAPNNPLDPDIPQAMQTHPMDWFEPTSASTTQPNTRPNTQPSSPNWSKKRTFEDFQGDQNVRNGFVQSSNIQQAALVQPSPPQPKPRRKRSSVVKKEQASAPPQPPTAITSNKTPAPLHTEVRTMGKHGLGQEQNAEAEEEEEEEEDDDDEGEEEQEDDATTEAAKSPSPAPWPANKARPQRNANPPPPKGSRRKKTSATPSTPGKGKSKGQRASSGSQVTPSSRVPLTLEQKKANHTSSEQRRRDATARAYAELYDLVPELEAGGKQSTMKKLEVVVAKVSRVKQRVEELRARMGLDPVSGRPIGPSGTASLLHSDVQGWR
ncbi:hypothetical protein A1O1_05449 [Capronia coronata CBS 617.96]|uniref:BHLH domain-containing protein n=1 Tax=Capronia coronata CBS 617.96 TaxID=1182541 RepID=W9Z1Y5_9EURO|nr:uncharacterized protein A1O1_05449 [Capronia coronata CBS 617.96]EXJ88519.1 hypothetical protein A1O1_05449 [Capronia coronata CBS 617.96]